MTHTVTGDPVFSHGGTFGGSVLGTSTSGFVYQLGDCIDINSNGISWPPPTYNLNIQVFDVGEHEPSEQEPAAELKRKKAPSAAPKLERGLALGGLV